MQVTRGLIIDTPHVDRILQGSKTWEMRSARTKQRGRVALIRKGSGTVVGTVLLVDCLGPLTEQQMLDNIANHRIAADRIQSGAVNKWRFAWVIGSPVALQRPVPYSHPSGAVIWVKLDESVRQQLAA